MPRPSSGVVNGALDALADGEVVRQIVVP